MNINDIIEEGEGYKQEFKRSLSKLDRNMVAFANASGGVIFIGVDDDGKPCPTKLTNRLKAQIINIASECEPPIQVLVKQIDEIITVEVKEGTDKPYSCKDGFFIRNGAVTQKLSRQEILELTVKLGRLQFDRMFSIQPSIEKDLSKKRIEDYVRLSSLVEVLKHLGAGGLLESLGVAERQQGKLILNHTGILFFTDNPQKFIHQAVMNYTRFQGQDKSIVLQRKIYTGTIIEQVEALIRDLLQNVPVGYSFDAKLSRTEKTHYPSLALREAVINAVMHRDYFETGADICIDHYQDRIEITNPGELIGSLTVENLGFKSLRRNPLIADLLYRCGWVEKLGSGIPRMRGLMQEWHLKPPVFASEGGFFSVTFFGPQKLFDYSGISHLPEREKCFLIDRNLIQEPFNSEVYSKHFGINLRTAQKDLAHLIKEGFIVREGIGKSARYRFK